MSGTSCCLSSISVSFQTQAVSYILCALCIQYSRTWEAAPFHDGVTSLTHQQRPVADTPRWLIIRYSDTSSAPVRRRTFVARPTTMPCLYIHSTLMSVPMFEKVLAYTAPEGRTCFPKRKKGFYIPPSVSHKERRERLWCGEVTYALGLSGERGTSSTTIHDLAWPSATEMFIMVEPRLISMYSR